MPAEDDQTEQCALCALCGRAAPRLTAHHLVPRARHRRRQTRVRFDAEARQETVPLCPPCHHNVHLQIDERTLAEAYFTVERLRRHPEVAKFSQWVRKQPVGKQVPMPRRRRR